MIPYVPLFSVACFLSGAFFTWLVRDRERRHRHEREHLAAEMTEQVRERYRAYLHLEARIKGVIDQFDEHERRTAMKLAARSVQVGRLEAALDRHEGLPGQERPEPAAYEVTVASPGQDRCLQRELERWEEKLQKIQAGREAELERQSAVIDELTRRVQHLRPVSARLGNSEQEAASWRAKCAELETRLSRATARGEASVADLQREREERAEERVAARDELEELHGQVSDRDRELARLRERIGQAERSGESELAAQRTQLSTTMARIAELEAENRQLQEDTRSHVEHMSAQDKTIKELKACLRDLDDLVDDVESLTAEREQHVKSLEESAARIAELEETLATSQSTAQHLTTEVARTTQARTRLETQLEEAKSNHAFAMTELRDEMKLKKVEVDQLQLAYDQVMRDGHEKLSAVAAHEQQLEAARQHLAAMEQQVAQSSQHALELQSHFEALRADRDSQVESVSELTRQLEGLRVALGNTEARLQEREQAAKRSAGELRDELSLKRVEVEQLQRAYDELVVASAAHAAAIEARDRQLQETRDRSAEIEAKITALSDELAEQRALVEPMRQARDLASRQLQEATRELHENRAELSKERIRAQKERAKADHEIEQLRDAVGKSRFEVEHLRSQLGDHEERVAEVTARQEELELGTSQTIAALRNDVRQKASELEFLRASQDELTRSQRDRTRQLKAQSGKIDTLQQELVEREAQLEESQTALDQWQARFEKVEAELAGVQELVTTKDAALVVSERRFEEYSEKTAETLDELRGQLEARISEMTDVRARVDELERVREAQEEALAVKEEELRLATAELDESRARLASTEQSLDSQSEQVRDLLAALEVAQSEMASTKGTVALQGSALAAAQSVLEDLKPMLETLEHRLTAEEIRQVEFKARSKAKSKAKADGDPTKE